MRRRTAAQAFLEYSLCLSVLLPLAVGLVDLAWLASRVSLAQQASSAGAIALAQGASDATIAALVTQTSAGGLTPSMLAIAPGCGGRTVGTMASLTTTLPLVTVTHILDTTVLAGRLATPVVFAFTVPVVQPCVP